MTEDETIEQLIVRLSQLLGPLPRDNRQESIEIIGKLRGMDGLTGVFNREGLDLRLEEEVARALRYNRHLSVIMVDVDYFKRYNDAYGHLQGDEALRHIARILKRQRRHADIVGRYGGEEFLSILPESTTEGTEQAAANLVRKVRDTYLNDFVGMVGTDAKQYLPGRTYKNLTISAGVASLGTSKSASDLLREVDTALYSAKKHGKDRVYIFDQNTTLQFPIP